MKLKKIASLALAGLMAVSMLAGCGDKTGTGNNNAVVVPSNTSAVTAVNDGQDASNDVKITFTSSSVLEKALKTVIADNGDNTASQVTNFKAAIATATGETYGATVWGAGETAGESKKQILLYTDDLEALTEEAAVKMLAEEVNKVVKTLVETTYDDTASTGTASGTKYYNYSYEGEVALVSATDSTGATTWYYAFTIEQTAKAVKLDK